MTIAYFNIWNILEKRFIRCSAMAQVTIYTTPTCGYCKLAKAFFQEHNIEFAEKDVTVDEEARNFLMQSNQQGVPVITVDNEMVVGFDKERLSQLLNIQ
jgi:glutaredoxin 3